MSPCRKSNPKGLRTEITWQSIEAFRRAQRVWLSLIPRFKCPHSMIPNFISTGTPKASWETFILAAAFSQQIIKHQEGWEIQWIILPRIIFWSSRYRIIYRPQIKNKHRVALLPMEEPVSRQKANRSLVWRRWALCRQIRMIAWSLIRRSWIKRTKRNRAISASAKNRGRARLASWLEILARQRA